MSIPSAGLLVSGYALGVAVGPPLLAVLIAKLPRKLALQLLMLVFIVGNVFCAVAPNYELLMIARVVTSFAHGSFFGIGAVVAASLVLAEKRASASALMFTGLTLANVLGRAIRNFYRAGIRLARDVLDRRGSGRVVHAWRDSGCRIVTMPRPPDSRTKSACCAIRKCGSRSR